MNGLDDFFTRKSSKYWTKSLIYDDRIVNFYDEGRFLFIESLKRDYIFDGYWQFDVKVEDIDSIIQILLNLFESKVIKFCKFDMLGLNGFISFFVYLNSDDSDIMKKFLKEILSLDILERNRFGIYKDIEFTFLKQNTTRKILLSNYVDLKNGMLE